MTMSALIVVRFAEMVVGLTANERFKAVRNLDSGNDIITSRWFAVAMVVLLVGSVVALVVVGLRKKVAELKAAEQSFASRSGTKNLNESEIDLLMAIAVKAGLRQSEDIFNMGEAFELGAAKMLEQSRLSGRPTLETGRLEKQLADLQAKLGYRRTSSSAANAEVKPDAKVVVTETKTENGINVDKSKGKVEGTAFIALYPFSKILEPTSTNGQLPQFTPAKVIDAAGRVVSIETTLSANVGDRVLVVIESQNVSEGANQRELIEDIGVVQRSAQPAESIDSPNGRRLAIEIAGLSDAQMTQLAGVSGRAKAKQATGPKEESK